MTRTKSQTIEAISSEVETQPVVTEVVEETVNLVTTNSEIAFIELNVTPNLTTVTQLGNLGG